MGDAATGPRPGQGQEVGDQAGAAPAAGIGRRQLGDREIEGLALGEVAGDAEVVERDEVGAAFGQAAADRRRHEERGLPRLAMAVEVVDPVDARELHAAEGDAAGAFRIGGELLGEQCRLVGQGRHEHARPRRQAVDETAHCRWPGATLAWPVTSSRPSPVCALME